MRVLQPNRVVLFASEARDELARAATSTCWSCWLADGDPAELRREIGTPGKGKPLAARRPVHVTRAASPAIALTVRGGAGPGGRARADPGPHGFSSAGRHWRMGARRLWGLRIPPCSTVCQRRVGADRRPVRPVALDLSRPQRPRIAGPLFTGRGTSEPRPAGRSAEAAGPGLVLSSTGSLPAACPGA